jgi:hypothetical protein
MVSGAGDGELAFFAGLLALEFHVQIVDLNSRESARLGDDLRIVLMRNHGAVHLQVNIGHQIIARLDAAVLDRDQNALLLAQIEHRLIDVLFLHFHLGLLDRKPRQRRKIDVRLNFDLEGIGQASGFGKLDFLRIVKMRLADDVQRILGNRLLIAFADERSLHLIANIAVEPFFDELPRRVSGPKAGKGRLAAKLLELLLQLGRDHFLRDFDGDLFRRRAGVLNLDLIGDRLRFLNGRLFLSHG